MELVAFAEGLEDSSSVPDPEMISDAVHSSCTHHTSQSLHAVGYNGERLLLLTAGKTE